MDAEREGQFKKLDLEVPPSEYWRRGKLIEEIGEDNMMWGSDFPHPAGVWPDSQEYI
jgi:uncharacterized protein